MSLTDDIPDREQQAEQLARQFKEKYNHLCGTRITVTEAAKKYDVGRSTLSRWAQRGLITILERTGKYTLLDEADVAYAAAVYHWRKEQTGEQTAGAPIFDAQGRPYILKYPDLARERHRDH
jgi:transposase-like protein